MRQRLLTWKSLSPSRDSNLSFSEIIPAFYHLCHHHFPSITLVLTCIALYNSALLFKKANVPATTFIKWPKFTTALQKSEISRSPFLLPGRIFSGLPAPNGGWRMTDDVTWRMRKKNNGYACWLRTNGLESRLINNRFDLALQPDPVGAFFSKVEGFYLLYLAVAPDSPSDWLICSYKYPEIVTIRYI